ncbi:hypothetical protein EBBID32_45240 [Sphingobium indicum BiD32]|uniref:Uncharacterized protein n=1 Tax=Sphingobium indicum BiD32 TaxID=1301087 RepID=N1MY26_9SPHN|nr:hypothetical protein [Sphingobium indicum]CCW20153.1 hypothetical protein EBBID32_45240 [Sphingobium indicum BiD32]
MVATMKIIPGLNLTAAPNMPRIPVQTEEEKRIARLPGLVHFFEPDRLSGSPLAAKDRATPGHPISTPSSAITASTSSAYDDKTVVTKTATQAAFAYGAGTALESCTILMACDLSQARITAGLGSTLWAFFNGPINASTAKYALSWRNSDDRLQFMENYAAGGTPLLLPTIDMPAGDVPFITALTYDRPTRTSTIFLNSATPLATLTHTSTPPTIDDDTQIAIGGLYQYGSSGWDGRIGRALIMDRSYNDPAYLPLLDREIAAMRAYYGI